jgi:hypothetical protein
MLSEVMRSNEPVMIELRGRARVAMITTERLQEFEAIERRQRQENAIAAFNELRERVGDRNSDLTEDEVMDLSVEAVRKARRDMREAGILKFES